MLGVEKQSNQGPVPKVPTQKRQINKTKKEARGICGHWIDPMTMIKNRSRHSMDSQQDLRVREKRGMVVMMELPV